MASYPHSPYPRMGEFGGTSGDRPVQLPCSEQGQREQVPWGCVQSRPEYLQGWRLQSLSGQPALVFDQPHAKTLFFNYYFSFQWNFLYFNGISVCASHPISGHHEEEHGSIFFPPSHQEFMHMAKIPLSPEP